MIFDTTIIATTPVSVLPMVPELQNLVFEFMHGSTTLYAQKKLAPICKELYVKIQPYQAVMDKTNSLSDMLTQYQTQGVVRSFAIEERGNRFKESILAIFTINWTDRSNGPFKVEVQTHPFNGSIYVTDLMIPAEEEGDDEYDEYSYQYGVTLDIFTRNFSITLRRIVGNE